MDQSILFAYDFNGKGSGHKINSDQVSTKIKEKKLAWVHLDLNHPETENWLIKELNYLDPFVVKALLAEETRPRITQINEGLLITLRGVNLNDNADAKDMVSIRLWIDKYRIISLQRRQLKAVQDIQNRLLAHQGPKEAGEFLGFLLEHLFERMEPILSDLETRTDNIEEKIIETPDTRLRKDIINIHRQSIIFHRYIVPQRDAIRQILFSTLTWINTSHKNHLQEIDNHATRYSENLVALRERAQVIKDELANVMNQKVTRNTYILSIVSAIFLPLGFLTGLFGINVGGIPGSNNADAFWIFCSLLGLIIGFQIFIFRRLKWL